MPCVQCILSGFVLFISLFITENFAVMVLSEVNPLVGCRKVEGRPMSLPFRNPAILKSQANHVLIMIISYGLSVASFY